MLGKQVRMERVMDRNTKRTVMVPMIHGVGMGPIEGIKDITEQINNLMRAARIGAEIGADLVRVPYSRSPASFKEVVSVCPG